MTRPKIFEDIGEVEYLTTTSKTIVGGINELDNEITVLNGTVTNNAEQINNCLSELETVKQSVSSGKSKVATAITGKGVPTVATATFQQMATNIDSIKLGSGNATADKVLTPFTFTNSTGVEQVGTMPNNGDVVGAIVNAVLKAGYTTGGTIANAVAENIKNGVNIAGIIGSLNPSHYATGTVDITNDSTMKLYGYSGSTSKDVYTIRINNLGFNPKFAMAVYHGGGSTPRYAVSIYVNKEYMKVAYGASAEFSYVSSIMGYPTSVDPGSGNTIHGRATDLSGEFGYFSKNLILPRSYATYTTGTWNYSVFG